MEKRFCLQQLLLEKLNSRMQNNEIGPLSYTIHKVKSKWTEDFNIKLKNSKTLRRKQGNVL